MLVVPSLLFMKLLSNVQPYMHMPEFSYHLSSGIVPKFCEEIFKGIKEKSKQPIVFEVKFSMLEIYSEVVHDLLNPGKSKKSGLKVRQHPKKGFYGEA